MTDRLSTLYQDLLGGSYDCVDRILLNAYFRMGHHPGGFRVWWRALERGGNPRFGQIAVFVRHSRLYNLAPAPRGGRLTLG